MSDLIVSSTATAPALTQQELDALEVTIQTGDRGGFYIAYNAMTGEKGVVLQAKVATFRVRLESRKGRAIRLRRSMTEAA